MPTAPGRFTVVKFVPDSVRFEPINVGVVVETPGGVATRMADYIDPRIRFADPYADTESLIGFLSSFDAGDLAEPGKSVISSLTGGSTSVPNFFFDLPRPVDASQISADGAAEILFDRLVRRTFDVPNGFVRASLPTAARTALRKAFASQRILGSRVRPDIKARGRSGIEWDLDFGYLADELVLVQTATTALKEDLRRREHGFKAFAALVDTTTEPGVRGVFASDEPADRNSLSGQLASMAVAHGLEFVGGQRQILGLALRVRDTARRFPETPDAVLETAQLALPT